MLDHFPQVPILLNGPVSSAFLDTGAAHFLDAINWVHRLPYGRNANRADYMMVFKERRGTCSTKHAALAALAEEQQLKAQLKMAICKLDLKVDPQVKWLLDRLEIDFFPEAHCYLSCDSCQLDVTFPNRSPYLDAEILEEYALSPKDIGAVKLTLHKSYLQRWMQENVLAARLSFDDVWNLREQWIHFL